MIWQVQASAVAAWVALGLAIVALAGLPILAREILKLIAEHDSRS